MKKASTAVAHQSRYRKLSTNLGIIWDVEDMQGLTPRQAVSNLYVVYHTPRITSSFPHIIHYDNLGVN